MAELDLLHLGEIFSAPSRFFQGIIRKICSHCGQINFLQIESVFACFSKLKWLLVRKSIPERLGCPPILSYRIDYKPLELCRELFEWGTNIYRP